MRAISAHVNSAAYTLVAALVAIAYKPDSKISSCTSAMRVLLMHVPVMTDLTYKERKQNMPASHCSHNVSLLGASGLRQQLS